MAADKAAAWPALVLTALAAVNIQQFLLFVSFCGEVDLFLQCPSPRLVLPSGFLWFLRQRVLGLQPPAMSTARSEPPVVYCTLWKSEKQGGPAIKYISPGRFKGSSGRNKSVPTFPHWKMYDCLPQQKSLLPILCPEIAQQDLYLPFLQAEPRLRVVSLR